MSDFYLIKEYIIHKNVIVSFIENKPKILLFRPEIVFDPSKSLKNLCIYNIISNNIKYLKFGEILMILIDEILQIDIEIGKNNIKEALVTELYNNKYQRKMIVEEINNFAKNYPNLKLYYTIENCSSRKTFILNRYEPYEPVGTVNRSSLDRPMLNLKFDFVYSLENDKNNYKLSLSINYEDEAFRQLTSKLNKENNIDIFSSKIVQQIKKNSDKIPDDIPELNNFLFKRIDTSDFGSKDYKYTEYENCKEDKYYLEKSSVEKINVFYIFAKCADILTHDLNFWYYIVIDN